MSALEAPKTGVAEWQPLLRKNLELLLPYLEHEGLVDLSINRPGEVVLSTDEGKIYREDPALTKKALLGMALILATWSDQRFDENHPRLSCVLPAPFGYRVQINAFDNVESGIAISVRAGIAKIFPLESYFPDDVANRIREAIRQKVNIFVTGQTGSGKTTLCNSLIREFDKDERIITLEDPAELSIPHRDTVRFTLSSYQTSTSQITFDDVGMDIMRHSPERFIVGEIRDVNVHAFLKLLNTGHAGTLATFHTNSAEKAFDRIVSMASGAKGGNMVITPEDVRAQLGEIGLIIEMNTKKEGGKTTRGTPRVYWVEEEKERFRKSTVMENPLAKIAEHLENISNLLAPPKGGANND